MTSLTSTNSLPSGRQAAQEQLKLYLSLNTKHSSSTEQQRHTPGYSPTAEYNEIGYGTFGAIFEVPGTVNIIKIPLKNPRDRPDLKPILWNDFLRHLNAYEAVTSMGFSKVHVPRPLGFVSADDTTWWNTHGINIPTYPSCDHFDGEPTNVLSAERIFPVPLPVREALIGYFSPSLVLAQLARESEKNKTCLIRPYLGKRRGNRPYPTNMMVNLRNFQLHVDQMEVFEMDVQALTRDLAQALAILHWVAYVDAFDIEFVFGAAPTDVHGPLPTYADIRNLELNSTVMADGKGMNCMERMVHLWMLDFDKVSVIPDSSKYVEMAIKGFVENDPYYPRPPGRSHSIDDGNWKLFRGAYTNECDRIADVRKENVRLPTKELIDRFLDGIENHYQGKRV